MGERAYFPWVQIDKYCESVGCTKEAIQERIRSFEFEPDVHWIVLWGEPWIHARKVKNLNQKKAAIALLSSAPEPEPIADESPPVRTALYRHFDAKKKLLYVGISADPCFRTKTHAKYQPWIYDVANITVEWLPSRAQAMAAELKAIRTEHPLYNVAGRPHNWNYQRLREKSMQAARLEAAG